MNDYLDQLDSKKSCFISSTRSQSLHSISTPKSFLCTPPCIMSICASERSPLERSPVKIYSQETQEKSIKGSPQKKEKPIVLVEEVDDESIFSDKAEE